MPVYDDWYDLRKDCYNQMYSLEMSLLSFDDFSRQ